VTEEKALPFPRIVVSAPHRSSGKSTVTTGLSAALRARGMNVQPFKKGPDFIDPMWLSAAAGSQCRNLDFFMMGEERIREVFARHAARADCSLVECNHGLHDGLDLEGSDSSAALARLLDAPVLLVVNAARVGRGIAPLLQGQTGFDPSVRFAGVVLNRVNSSRHEKKIRAALERYCDVPVLGVLPYRREMEIAERHLGLTPLREDPALASRIEELGREVGRHLDLDEILAAAGRAPALETTPEGEERAGTPSVRIGVATDEAFNFYYPENLEALRRAGAEIVAFSPLRDGALPAVDGLYLGGGFPEFFMEELESNATLRAEIRRAVVEGMPVWAECGGLMYLARSLRWKGTSRPMAGALPCDVEMSERPAGHGYVILEETGKGPGPQAGRTLRGHEFHHSVITGLDGGVEFAYRTLRGNGVQKGFDGIRVGNCVATYAHLHADGAPFWAADFTALVKREAG
jgi:cobyrinic acid a,c-diamide synthase